MLRMRLCIRTGRTPLFRCIEPKVVGKVRIEGEALPLLPQRAADGRASQQGTDGQVPPYRTGSIRANP